MSEARFDKCAQTATDILIISERTHLLQSSRTPSHSIASWQSALAQSTEISRSDLQKLKSLFYNVYSMLTEHIQGAEHQSSTKAHLCAEAPVQACHCTNFQSSRKRSTASMHVAWKGSSHPLEHHKTTSSKREPFLPKGRGRTHKHKPSLR